MFLDTFSDINNYIIILGTALGTEMTYISPQTTVGVDTHFLPYENEGISPSTIVKFPIGCSEEEAVSVSSNNKYIT